MLKQRSPEHAFKIVAVVVLEDRDVAAVLKLAANLARSIDEALSAAIVETAAEDITAFGAVDHVQLITDEGVAGSVDGHAVVLGNSSFLAGVGLSVGSFGEWAERTAPEGEAVIFVAVDGHPAGFLRLSTNY
jgi:P-type Cu+ transporter